MKLKKLLVLSCVALMISNALAGTISGYICNRATVPSDWFPGWGTGYTYAKGQISLSNSGDSRYVSLAGKPLNQQFNPTTFDLVRDIIADYDVSYSR